MDQVASVGVSTSQLSSGNHQPSRVDASSGGSLEDQVRGLQADIKAIKEKPTVLSMNCSCSLL